MKVRISCRKRDELITYLDELITYLKEFGWIPIEENDWIPVPDEAVLRIRYDQLRDGGSLKMMLDWKR